MASLYASNAPLLPREDEPDVDPLSSVANIADAMLVFACGLMVALVVAWNVDLEAVKQVEIDQSQEVDDVTTLQDILSAEGSSYIQRGTVYQDPKTGTMYLIEEEAGESREQGQDGQAEGAAAPSNAEGSES